VARSGARWRVDGPAPGPPARRAFPTESLIVFVSWSQYSAAAGARGYNCFGPGLVLGGVRIADRRAAVEPRRPIAPRGNPRFRSREGWFDRLPAPADGHDAGRPRRRRTGRRSSFASGGPTSVSVGGDTARPDVTAPGTQRSARGLRAQETARWPVRGRQVAGGAVPDNPPTERNRSERSWIS
jgi:hypothetical protein